MQLYRKESNRLKKIHALIKSRFGQLGINKKQELTRLLYEISKKESIPPENIIKTIESGSFNKIKLSLLKRRFPFTSRHKKIAGAYLPKIEFNAASLSNLKKQFTSPKKIYIERKANKSFIAKRFKDSFPKAGVSEIPSLKEYLKINRSYNIEDYNKRVETLFITYENYDFFKKCPCTKKAVRCGYHIFNLSFGCIFDCTYCYLQEYTNIPGIIFPANIDKFFNKFSSYKKTRMRIGTGEFSDSLMMDHITRYSLSIVDFFKKHKEVTFEFKTKSTNIDNLLKTSHSENIVIAWSLSPQKIIDENESFTSSLKERVKASKKCSDAGYKLAFHFDPVVYFEGWEKEYKKVIDLLFSEIKPKNISWISIGTLRFNPNVKKVIESRFPGNKILDEELLQGFDNKLRYPEGIRHSIYEYMLKTLFRHSKKLPVYLCMEDISTWKKLGPTVPIRSETGISLF